MKKSIVISLLTVATLFCTALCSFASTGIVTTDTLRLREEPSTDSKILTLLSMDDKIEIISEENGWYKVKSGEYVGYVATQYINVLTDKNTNVEQELNKDNNANEENNDNSQDQETENQNEENTEMTKVTATVLAEGQKIYITPVINSLVIKTLDEEKQIEVVSEVNGWSYIKLGTTAGWVRTENIERKEVEEKASNSNNSSQKTGYISGSSVNFRKTPSTSGEIIRKLTRNTKVTILNQGDGWAEVKINGDTGYVSTDYITDKKIQITSRSSSTRTTAKKTTTETNVAAKEETYVPTGSVSGTDVVNYAKQYLGYRYVYGGSTPSTGFDCSGFTSYVYKHFGISLSRSSKAQASNGRAVSKSDLQVGDILCFARTSGSKTVGHVGIYIGGGKFIHAANSNTGVIISNVDGAGYYYMTARRVI